LLKAEKWYLISAERGNINAQYNLGCLYLKMRDSPNSWDDAFKWFKKAAEQGDAQAQTMLKRLNSSKIELETIDREMKNLMDKVQKRKAT